MPRVSVVIPSYNHAAFVAEAVRSVLAQTLADLELVVVDDGSTDDSLAVLRGLADPRLQVHRQVNQGAHAAINVGLARARGDVLAVLNSDDAYQSRRLARAVAALDSEPSSDSSARTSRSSTTPGNGPPSSTARATSNRGLCPTPSAAFAPATICARRC